MSERSPNDIVGLVAFQCTGAKPEPLAFPVSVTVDVSLEGERRVGCPFLEEVIHPDKKYGRSMLCRCTAGSKTTLLEFIKTLDPTKPSEENLRNIFTHFPLCIHKNPV